jgi:hypothetical protein
MPTPTLRLPGFHQSPPARPQADQPAISGWSKFVHPGDDWFPPGRWTPDSPRPRGMPNTGARPPRSKVRAATSGLLRNYAAGPSVCPVRPRVLYVGDALFSANQTYARATPFLRLLTLAPSWCSGFPRAPRPSVFTRRRGRRTDCHPAGPSQNDLVVAPRAFAILRRLIAVPFETARNHRSQHPTFC